MQLSTINEGWGRSYEFDYSNFHTDPRPRILFLGKFKHPSTGNILLGGIALNRLDDEQLKRLRQNLRAILQPRNLQLRYWRGRRLLPDIFGTQYKTWDVDYVGAVTKDTLTFWPSIGELEQAEKAAKDQEMQKYDQEMRTKHKIGRARPTLAEPEPEPTPAPADVLTTEPEPEPTPAKSEPIAPAVDVELARPETEVTPEPTAEVEKPPQELAQAGATDTPSQQPEVEAPPAGPMVRRGPRGKTTGGETTPAPKPKRLTSAQRRRQQAEQIKKALDTSRQQKKQKPEPPDEIGGVMGMFKKGK